jgi:hypothetical protein
MSTLGALRAASSSAMKKAQAARLREAAEVIAVAVRAAAAKTKSKRIPASVKIIGGTSGLWVNAGGPDGSEAPNAYPFEQGVRHPLFGMTGRGDAKDRTTPGHKGHWYPQPHIPFLEEGAEAAVAGGFHMIRSYHSLNFRPFWVTLLRGSGVTIMA